MCSAAASSICLVDFTSNKYYKASDHFMFHGTAVISSDDCLQGESAQLAMPEDLEYNKWKLYVQASHAPNESKPI